jgi:acetyltransferase-like isoleucine patch superfamily enzyme
MKKNELYFDHFELEETRVKTWRLLQKFNLLLPVDEDSQERQRMISQIFGNTGRNCTVYAPFRCDYGCNIYVGDNFFANFNCTMLDDAKIVIGDNVMIGPNSSLITVGHPIDYTIRNNGYKFSRDIIIEDNVWLGANVVVNPGIKIGKNTVIGSGSIVTKNIPESVVAAGNPCRVFRNI